MDRREEVLEKHARVARYLDRYALDGVFLSSVANFAWFSAGGDSHVENHSKYGVAYFLLTKSKRFLLTNNIEIERILSEQLNGIEDMFEVAVYDWHENNGLSQTLMALTQNLETAADLPTEGLAQLDPDFNTLRYQLTEREISKCKWLGRSTAEAVEFAARSLEPGMNEFEIEALMSYEITRRGIQPVVLLVAGDERNSKYRHPLPTMTKFTHFAKLVCCARKWGLITALTRSVHVGEIPQPLAEKHKAVACVDAVYMNATRPGNTAAKIIAAGQSAYEHAGYPGEWRHHHQGGAIGYEAREYIATQDNEAVVLSPQAFAWNPSIENVKSEDTILVSAAGLEVTTKTGNWPQIKIDLDEQEFERPDILIV